MDGSYFFTERLLVQLSRGAQGQTQTQTLMDILWTPDALEQEENTKSAHVARWVKNNNYSKNVKC